MLNNAFFHTTSNDCTMQKRLIFAIIGYEANWIFFDRAIEISEKEDPEEDNVQLSEFRADKVAAFQGKELVTQLYESEYGKISEEDKLRITSTALRFAKVALETYGWIEVEVEKEA